MAAAISLGVGLTDLGGEMFTGLCRAFGAIFFILAFIVRMVGKAEESGA